MKKIVLALSVIALLSSCSTTSNGSANNTLSSVVNTANTIAEISNLLNSMNLGPSQASVIGSALNNYVTQYNSLAGMSTNSQGYKTKLKSIKSNALSSISSALNGNEYSQFTNALITIANSPDTNLSNGTIAVLSSLVN